MAGCERLFDASDGSGDCFTHCAAMVRAIGHANHPLNFSLQRFSAHREVSDGHHVVDSGARLAFVKALAAHRDRVARRESVDLVFGNGKGEPLRESKVLTKRLQPAAVAAGLGRVTWHQFRHIHSSLLNDLNVPSKIAQEQLGHASITTTLGIYTHAIPASHRDAVVAVEERLFAQLLSNVLESGNTLAGVKPVSDAVN